MHSKSTLMSLLYFDLINIDMLAAMLTEPASAA